jgi:hypothetical protein
MKRIITAILFICLASIVSSAAVSDFIKLKDVIDEVAKSLKSSPKESPFTKYTEKINLECIKEKVNVAENGEKLVTIYEGQIIMLAAYLNCFEGDEAEFVNFMTTQGGIHIKHAEFVACGKLKLQKFEPNSILLDNFDSKAVNSSMTLMCGYINSDEELDNTISKVEAVVGPIDKFTCGAVTKNDVVKFMVNIYVVPHETRAEVKTQKMQEMIDTFKAKITKISDCIISKA